MEGKKEVYGREGERKEGRMVGMEGGKEKKKERRGKEGEKKVERKVGEVKEDRKEGRKEGGKEGGGRKGEVERGKAVPHSAHPTPYVGGMSSTAPMRGWNVFHCAHTHLCRDAMPTPCRRRA